MHTRFIDQFDVDRFSDTEDYGCVKPSSYLFGKAIEALDVGRAKIVFVGDSLKHDIASAKAVGLLSIWINAGINRIDQSIPTPEFIIKDLRDLIER